MVHALTVPPGVWAVIRTDGRGFSPFTEAHFTKPYDERMRRHMTAAATALMTGFGGVYGCTHSDEVSVALPPQSQLFGRGLEKLVSVSAGICSAAFTAAAGLPAHFDSRVWDRCGKPHRRGRTHGNARLTQQRMSRQRAPRRTLSVVVRGSRRFSTPLPPARRGPLYVREHRDAPVCRDTR